MTAERWAQIKDVFGSVLEMPEADRGAYLESSCAGDRALRDEVEHLLAASEQPSIPSPVRNLLNQPGVAPLVLGQMVNSYRILGLLGAGGMSLVYYALDTKLDRQVALKFLPPELGVDEHARAALVNEARAASTLDHPNVGTIYGIEEIPGGQP